jgi:nitrate reductase NapE component
MSIRYTCTQCHVVMKIKEEKAGSKARCPQCKLPFVVPAPGTADGQEADGDSSADPDLPLELTPEVEVPDAVFPVSQSPSYKIQVGKGTAGSAAEDKKASVASLMRDFEATKTKKKSRRSAAEVPTLAAQTTGTAADALARAYQQKRENAANPQPKPAPSLLTPERRLAVAYFSKLIPAVLIALLAGYGVYRWMVQDVYNGPPLARVSGVVKKNGLPVEGIGLRFVPRITGDDVVSSGKSPGKAGKSSSSAKTDASGQFRMMYTALVEGVPIGACTLELSDSIGLPIRVPEKYQNQTVPEEGLTDLQIDLD